MADLTITHSEASAWLDAYKRAWETQDPDLIVSLFTPDATYREAAFDPPDVGHAGIRAYWEKNVVAGQRDIAFGYDLWAVEGHVAYAHWHSRFIRVTLGSTVRLDGVFKLAFAGRGTAGLLCQSLEEWWVIAETA
jgi:ketosteroid isomerase-like protein